MFDFLKKKKRREETEQPPAPAESPQAELPPTESDSADLDPADAIVVAETNFGVRLKMDPNVPEQKLVINCGEWEGECIRECARHLREGAVVLDIGANVGLFCCCLGPEVARRGGRIYAFEPVSANFARLRENVTLNAQEDLILCERVAFGPERGELTMRIVAGSPTNNAVGDNMASNHDRENMDNQGWTREVAPMVPLDEWATKLDRCDLIKIDTEGADLNILRSGERVIRRCRPVIHAEFNRYWMSVIGQSLADVFEFFGPLGYRIAAETPDGFKPMNSPGDIEIDPSRVSNYLITPES